MSDDSDYFERIYDIWVKHRKEGLDERIPNYSNGVMGTDGIVRDEVTGVEIDSDDHVPPFSVKGTF